MAVFISYHSSKRAVVKHLADYFARHEITTWYAPRDVPPGTDWDEQISAAIKNSTALVLLFCSSADSSMHVKREILLADRARIPIYWIRLEKVEPEKLGYFLNPTQWIDWLDDRDTTLDTLARDLKTPGRRGQEITIPEADLTTPVTKPLADWPAGVIAFENERVAADAAAHVYFKIAQESPDGSVLLPTGRAATQLFRGMLRVAHEYAPHPFGEARLVSDTETFGVYDRHLTSRTRHVVETLIEPLVERGLGPSDSQVNLLTGQITDDDPLARAQRVLRLWPPAVHGVSISPAGEVLGYEVGLYSDPDEIVSDGCRIVELSEQGRKYIDPKQPSRSVITVGLGTALESPGLMVLGFDKSKARILRQMVEYPETAGIPATLLRRNERAVIVATRAVAEAANLRVAYHSETAREGSEWIISRFS